jgi:hypothetical protein
MKPGPFFLPGDAPDPAYVATRDSDHPRAREAKDFCESLWQRFAPLADPHLRQDARVNFQQRFWEMYLGVTLLERGITLTRHGAAGPEYYATIRGRRIWIEAIAPKPGEGVDRVPDFNFGAPIAEKVPTAKILLRFTHAFEAKRERYLFALKRGIIQPGDAYVLAVNSGGIPRARLHSTDLPYVVQAFLAVGSLHVILDSNTGQIVDRFRGHQPSVKKGNQTEISTGAFLDDEAAFCSAILHSGVDCANHPSDLGGDFAVVHNPRASIPLDAPLFDWCEQIYRRGDELHRDPPNRQ